MSYPEVKIERINENNAPVFETGVLEITEENLQEVDEFYHRVLIPQLSCAPDGRYPAIPTPQWITAVDNRTIVVARKDGELRGVWIVREGQILFPCADNQFIALIYRNLWDETTKHFDYIWAYTDNKVMQGFIKAAKRPNPLPTSPKMSPDGDKLEWRR